MKLFIFNIKSYELIRKMYSRFKNKMQKKFSALE